MRKILKRITRDQLAVRVQKDARGEARSAHVNRCLQASTGAPGNLAVRDLKITPITFLFNDRLGHGIIDFLGIFIGERGATRARIGCDELRAVWAPSMKATTNRKLCLTISCSCPSNFFFPIFLFLFFMFTPCLEVS